MEDIRLISKKALTALKEQGADKAACTVSVSQTREFNVDGGEFSLFRTLFDKKLNMTAYAGGRKGTVSVNRLDDEAVRSAAADCMEVASSAQPDEAWDIAPYEKERHFVQGQPEPDTDKLFERTKELVRSIAERHPRILIEQLIVSHIRADVIYANTNGTVFTSQRGAYCVEITYSAHDGDKASSFFGSEIVTKSLDRPFIELAELDKELTDVENQLDPIAVEGKFEGVALLPPSSLGSFLFSALDNFAGEMSILDGTSIWKDKLGRRVANERLTISADPYCEDIVFGQRYTPEGFISESYDIIKDGELKSFMLGLYVSNKTELPRAKNSGFDLVVKGGDTPVGDIIAGIEKGIIVGRFSGGDPSTSGDFSGVAKNSFLIENGKVTSALSETMINGNLADMLSNIVAISRETVKDGTSVLPYIAFGGVTISGK